MRPTTSATVEWKADLDALVEETMAFARRIHVQPAMPRAIVEPNRIPPIDWNKSMREGIQAAWRTLGRTSCASKASGKIMQRPS
jgi:hypothetical protein